MSEEKKDFVVKDRRRFAQDDQEAESKDEGTQSPSSAEESQEPEDQKSSQTVESEEKPQLPEINFPTFIVSLNASALLHLGAIEDPTSGKKTKDLPMAKQTIDILSMLEEKTAGNLTSEEENLLKNILYDLRMMYVKEKG
jgi:hypothetical protein